MSSIHKPEMVTINSPGHHLHNTQGRVFFKHDNGNVNVQVTHSPKKGHVSNLTLKPSQFVKGVVDLNKDVKEDVEAIDEISTDAVRNYMWSAISNRKNTDAKILQASEKNRKEFSMRRHKNITKLLAKSSKRSAGIIKATERLKEDAQLDEIKMSPEDEKRNNLDYGKRATKLLKHSWAQHDVSTEKAKAGDKEGAAKTAAQSSRAHKLFLKARDRHQARETPQQRSERIGRMMSGASDYYKSKKPGQYTGDSYEPQGEMLPEMIGANAKVMGIHDYFKKNGDPQKVSVAPVAKQHKEILDKIKTAQKSVSQKLAAIKKMNEGTSAAIRMQRALEKIRAERERSERRGQELMDNIKKQQAAEKAAKPVKEETMKSLSIIREQASKAVHPDAIHVQPVKVNGQTKYKVHAVGKNFAHGVKTGEHLSDTELDDFSEMGGKVKHVK